MRNRQDTKLSRKRVPVGIGDTSLFLALGALLSFGILIVYDSTIYYSLTFFDSAYRMTLLHIIWLVLGLFWFWIIYSIDYHWVARRSHILLVIISIVLIMLALKNLLRVLGVVECNLDDKFVPCINGAYRWFNVNPDPLPKIPFFGVLGFQPSEVAKLALILYLGSQISKLASLGRGSSLSSSGGLVSSNGLPTNRIFGVVFIASAAISLLVLAQPNMSTSVLLFLIGSAVLFCSGISIKPMLVVYPGLLVLAVLFILITPYRRERLMTYFGKSSSEEKGYHAKQVMIGLGSGGLFGVGLGQSRQKLSYLPEVSSDSIFAIVGEELGFVGTTGLIALFGFLIYRGLVIARAAPDLLGRLLASGVTSWIALQSFINIAAMVGLIPLTGLPLPLISYGGSSLVVTLIGLGILANVSRYETSADGRPS